MRWLNAPLHKKPNQPTAKPDRPGAGRPQRTNRRASEDSLLLRITASKSGVAIPASTGGAEGIGIRTYRPLQALNRGAMAALGPRHNVRFPR